MNHGPVYEGIVFRIKFYLEKKTLVIGNKTKSYDLYIVGKQAFRTTNMKDKFLYAKLTNDFNNKSGKFGRSIIVLVYTYDVRLHQRHLIHTTKLMLKW